MASYGKGRPARKADGPTLEQCLAEARSGKPAPVYFFDGDAFLSGRAARELASALVPEAQRDLNQVELDAAASPAEIAVELATRGLFAGPSSRKVVLVSEPAFLTSKEDSSGVFERARDLWTQGRQREAARRLLALAVKAGWKAEDLVPGAPRSPGPADWKSELGVVLDAGDAAFVADAARFAVGREMKVARDDASALDAALASGFPPGHVLVVAAGKVDGKLPLVKKLAAAGKRVSFAIGKEGAWGEERVVLRPILDALLAGTGKAVDASAEARLGELVGDDARTLAGAVAKLVAYAGDRKGITVADVDAVVTRVASDPFFALGNAVEAKDLPRAIAVLGRSLADGASPFMLLGSLASTVRRLVLERERARKAAGDRRITSFDAWQTLVLPRIPEDEIGAKKPYGFWMKYQAAQRYPRGALLRALADLADADLAMKSGSDERPLLERVLWRLMPGKDIL
ncbi:MAG: DNA polymerase III subunit delta [Anaeromyxobacter sp. RBG_16_69_14]|nr:MAG: DNA polymerase III subunit delta [Anaeromyxobacter sp. RBG_16_69_14]